MSYLDLMLEHNAEFAERHAGEGSLPPALPGALSKVKALIIGCADMRVDPADLFDIELGQAVVIRNIGGRVTPTLIEELGLLGRIGQVAQRAPGGGGEFHLIVLHHTDCGITRLQNNPEMLARYFQIGQGDVPGKAVMDPRKAVAVDVALLRSIPALPAQWILSGLVYDVATGRVEVIVPPAPIRAA